MMDGGGWGMWGFSWWMMLIPLLFLFLLVWLVVRLADSSRSQPQAMGGYGGPPPAVPYGGQATPAQPSRAMQVCPYCGENLAGLAASPRFCPHCAAALTVE